MGLKKDRVVTTGKRPSIGIQGADVEALGKCPHVTQISGPQIDHRRIRNHQWSTR